jgi:hypothetical protein
MIRSIMALIATALLYTQSVMCLAADDVMTEARTDRKTFIVRPYVWGLGFKGDAGIRDVETEVDASFSDVLDALELGFMMGIEGRSGRWGVIVDGLYMKVSQEKPTPGPFFSVVEPTLQLGTIDAAVAYRVIEGERGWLDLLAGARYVKVEIDLDLSPDYDAVDDISHQVVTRAASAIRDEVQNEVDAHADEIAGKLAVAVGDIADQAKELVREEVGSRVKQRIEDILEKIGDRTPGPRGADVSVGRNRGTVGDIIKDKINDRLQERLQEIRDELRDAIAEEVKSRISDKLAEIAGKKAEIKAEIRSAARAKLDELKRNASTAVKNELEKAEKELAALLKEGMNEAANTDISKDRDWVDPYVGVRARYNLTDEVYLGARGDIGGFGVGSDLTWQAFGGLGYVINDSVTIEAGYRHLDIDYDHDDFIMDMAISGPMVGVEICF